MNTALARLARVEGTKLARNPVLWLSFGLVALWAIQADDAITERFLLIGYGLTVPAFVVCASAAIAVRRSRVSGTDGLLDTMPVTPDSRTVAHGVAGLAAGVAGLAVMIAAWAYLHPGPVLGQTTDTNPLGVAVPRPNLAQLLQGPMAMVMFCALAVAIAQWIPSWLLTIALVLPMFIQFLWFGVWSGTRVSAATWLWPLSSGMVVGGWDGCGSSDATCNLWLSGFDATTPWWHVAYLVALAVTFVTIAVLRSRRDRRAWIAFALALATVVALAAIQATVYEQYVPGGRT
jgi:hypothetical protein